MEVYEFCSDALTDIFNPFEINEMQDQIMEYHGELGSIIKYLNQFSHQLSKSINYSVEDSFNKNAVGQNVGNNLGNSTHVDVKIFIYVCVTW